MLFNHSVTENTDGKTIIACGKIRNVGKKDPSLV